MDYTTLHKRNHDKDRRRSIIMTILMTLLLFLFIYFYQFTKMSTKEEVVTTMLINFGDDKMGELSEEPAMPEPLVPPIEEVQPEKVEPIVPPVPEKSKPMEAVREKVITGKNEKAVAKKAEKTLKKEEQKEIKTEPQKETKKEVKKEIKTTEVKSAKKTTAATTTPTETAPKSKPQPNSAVGNLIKGRGNKPSSQGDGGTSGNTGDPLGGDTNGNSKVGVDRKLVAFIPGTMGRGGTQPTHSCSASGTITISFTVDKAGNVTSARRLGGLSDACVVSTTISWVKKYVKAEKATTSSTGTYSITF